MIIHIHIHTLNVQSLSEHKSSFSLLCAVINSLKSIDYKMMRENNPRVLGLWRKKDVLEKNCFIFTKRLNQSCMGYL